MNTGPEPTRAELVRALAEKTESGAIVWRKTDDPAAFLFSSRSGSFLLRSGLLGAGMYSLVVYDQKGTKLAEIGSSDPAGGPTAADPASVVLWTDLSRLYNAAQASAEESDRVLGELLDEIRSLSA